MKKFWIYFLMLALVPALTLNSCKKSDDDNPDPATGTFETLKTYMVQNNLDLPDLLNGWVIDAKLIDEGGIVDPADYSIPDYYVFDIRDAEAFNNGHIKNAINVPLADVVTRAADYSDKPILVVCHTGQTAGHAVMALRLSGYSDAKVLKWGMAGWNDDFSGSWANNIGNLGAGSPNWVTDAAPAPGSYSDPAWTSTTTDPATLLQERVDAMLQGGLIKIAPADVLAAPENYQIVNFWPEADYLQFGHFKGAYQINPISLDGDVVKAIDPNVETLIYCYTGQTSSMVTAWLNVLGYNAKSILFGVNALNYDELEAASKPTYHGSHGYDYVTE
ncbi:MAG: hypothetical protein Kow00127_04400 [Bacteroidales bacterium]